MLATGDSANRKWCDGIVVVYDQLLAGKYPFVRGKTVRDAHVDDIQKFFQPKAGTLWQYFAESLQADIDHPHAFRKIANVDRHAAAEIVVALNRDGNLDLPARLQRHFFFLGVHLNIGFGNQ